MAIPWSGTHIQKMFFSFLGQGKVKKFGNFGKSFYNKERGSVSEQRCY